MELALSLGGGDSVPTTPFLFLDRKNINKDLGFCMGLGTRSCGQDQDQDQDRRLIDLSSADPTVQIRPSPVLARLPWLTHNKLISERGCHVDANHRSPVDDVASVGPNNATVASPMLRMDFSGKIKSDYLESERACSRTTEEDENDSVSTRKKLRLSKDQSAFLEESFKEHSSLNPKLKLALAKMLNLRPRQVEVWFQNRRARTKLKQTEVDCEYLKRSCEKLGEENKRLQKELQELRAIKTILPFQNQLPPTTLTMCPSCERVASTSTITTAVTDSPATSIDKPTPMFPFFQAQAQ